jgi:hypothetical protein
MHSGMMETTLTVTITDPAKASEYDIIPGGTNRFPLYVGWQKTTAAPMHVEAPAMQER